MSSAPSQPSSAPSPQPDPPAFRRGPRPLPLHLLLAGWRAQLALAMVPPHSSRSSCDAWQSWSGAWPVSARTRREALRLLGDLDASGSSADELRAAVARRLLDLDSGLIGGLAAYRRQPPPPDRPGHPVLWQEGASRLLDHGSPESTGPTVLFVPSLVNRAWVLDLMPGYSILAWLAEQGARPLLLDWGYPGDVERGMDLTGLVAGRLERALAAAPGPVILAGYCMGGLLALAAAMRRPDRVRALALLATPWDFHAGDQAPRARSLAGLLPLLEPMLATTGTLPVEVIQALFAQLDPFGVARKFRAFARLKPGSERAAHFVALEDWLNDGVPLPAPVARECLGGWYGQNTSARLQWRVAGEAVDPARWQGPAFVAIPHRDRIVPPDSARALAEALPGAVRHDAAAGHIGMVAGRTAETALWRPLLDWVRGLE